MRPTVTAAFLVGILVVGLSVTTTGAVCQSAGKSCGLNTASNDRLCCPGTLCGWGNVCQPGCRINGTFYPTGTLNPANPCLSCQPSRSASAWSNVAAGTRCGSQSSTLCDDPNTCNGTGQCLANNKPNGIACSDGDLCTRTDLCQAGSCVGSDPVVCTASDTCHDVGTCDRGTAQCSNPPLADGTACNDDDLCTAGETCQAGACGGGTPVGDAVSIAPGSSPAGGYLPLSAFGIPPIAGMGDDVLINFNVPAFSYAGDAYTRLGVSSNGYVVVGGGSGPDNTITNQNFPNPTRPNNVLAPFWTDLNPAAAGAIRIGTLTDGTDTWIVVDWQGVREFSLPRLVSTQIWIGIAGDANPGQDISFAYGTVQGNGDLGLLTVGAENACGLSGGVYYYNGAGTLPTNTTQLRVTSP